MLHIVINLIALVRGYSREYIKIISVANPNLSLVMEEKDVRMAHRPEKKMYSKLDDNVLRLVSHDEFTEIRYFYKSVKKGKNDIGVSGENFIPTDKTFLFIIQEMPEGFRIMHDNSLCLTLRSKERRNRYYVNFTPCVTNEVKQLFSAIPVYCVDALPQETETKIYS
ncbi:hypothetical protein H312_00019 [Anncaliia algerae PRA339]|uniref:Uncharacterized protein n=1 Tax=Anncaliia algerae PRA339 TaxID=1288291 RepID=A0A059F5V5_9MICR|nr:hypothetical protein H312_00019 [Anncaliia algerae PRA339]